MVCRKAVKRLARRGAKSMEQKEELSAFRDECADIDEEISDNLACWVSATHSEVHDILCVHAEMETCYHFLKSTSNKG